MRAGSVTLFVRPETARWLAKAEEDLATARYLLEGGHAPAAAFHAQQAAEKGVKAVLLEREGRVQRIHSVLALGQQAKVPEHLLPPCRLLTPAYTAFRYPDADEPVGEEDAEDLLRAAREVMAWVRSQLS